jgi:hypothetical protein
MMVMERGQPYGTAQEDKKRRLVEELGSIARSLDVNPVIIGGLAVAHHGYLRTTRDVAILMSEDDADVVGLLKRHWRKRRRLTQEVVGKLASAEARTHFLKLVDRAGQERLCVE